MARRTEFYQITKRPEFHSFPVGQNLISEDFLKFVYDKDGKHFEKIVPMKVIAPHFKRKDFYEIDETTGKKKWNGFAYMVPEKVIENYVDPNEVKKTICKMKEPFYLSHVVLYAKRWYNWTEDIYEDLSKMLELDNQPGYHKTEREGIARKLLYAYENWCEFLDTCPEYHMSHGRDYLMTECFNLYRKSNDPKYNFTDFTDVIIMAVLLQFSYAENEYMNIPCPHYDEEHLPNKNGLFGNFSSWYEEANNLGINGNKNIAKFFNEKVKEAWKQFE